MDNPRRLRTTITKAVHSVRFRLALWFVAILAVILAGFSAFVYTRQAQEYARETVARLEGKSRQLEAYYRYAYRAAIERDHGDILPPSASTAMPLLTEDETVLIVDAQGAIAQQLGPLTKTDIPLLQQAAQDTIHNAGLMPADMPVAFSYAPGELQATTTLKYQYVVTPLLLREGVNMLIILGSPLDGSRLYQLLITLILGSLGLLLLALGGGYWLAGRAMKPVQLITHTARQISDTDLSKRLRLGGSDELSELADTFDQMLDRLQAGFERQRQFTADASHELRTPLTIIELEASRALGHTRSVNEYESALVTIKSENELMSHMVNDLLTLARMDAGQTKLRFEALDLSDVALDVVERLSPLAKQRHVALLAGELPTTIVQGDRLLLGQMLTNLVENAIKYSVLAPHSQAQVQVETGCDSSAWVRVHDNGPGIPAGLIPKLFDRFYRVDEARGGSDDISLDEPDKPRPNGSGLGLSIVQWIVKSHAGTVNVTSESGCGSTFEVRLPAHSVTPGLA
ncbi:MAG TPA: HAMP domain-containing sensor histidine kinase [Anaerolineae bacterium]